VLNLSQKPARQRHPQLRMRPRRTSCRAATSQAGHQPRTRPLARSFLCSRGAPGSWCRCQAFANDGIGLLAPLAGRVRSSFLQSPAGANRRSQSSFHVPRSWLGALPLPSTLGQCCPASSVARTPCPEVVPLSRDRGGGPANSATGFDDGSLFHDNWSCPFQGPQG